MLWGMKWMDVTVLNNVFAHVQYLNPNPAWNIKVQFRYFS